MKIHDVTLKIVPEMVVWPGDPHVQVNQIQSIKSGDDVNLTQINMCAHTGTHVDAPFHFIDSGKKVDNLQLENLCGPVQVIQVPSNRSEIDADFISIAGVEPLTERVLFKTTNSALWKKMGSEFSSDYVGIAPNAAELLAGMGIKVVGIDYLSVAAGEHIRSTHEILLGAGVILIEGLDLSDISAGRYTLYCLPLNLAGADGAPARTILVES